MAIARTKGNHSEDGMLEREVCTLKAKMNRVRCSAPASGQRTSIINVRNLPLSVSLMLSEDRIVVRGAASQRTVPE